jgi:organic radical activating enzyme
MIKAEELFADNSLEEVLEAPDTFINRFNDYLAGRRIIIYGAGIVGATLFRALQAMSIPVTYIVDRNAGDIPDVDGFPVNTPDSLKKITTTEDHLLVVAASAKPAKLIMNDLAKLDVGFAVLENGEKVAQVLQCAICATRFISGEDIEHALCSDCTILDNICPALRAYGIKLTRYKPGRQSVMKSRNTTMIGYILGNVCTLNCRHCCESLPMFPNDKRRFVDTQTVISDIQRLASAAEFVTLVEFIGGEPFLHPGLPEIIACALQIPNAAFVRIFTNGTVAPSEELLSVLKDRRVAVYISNYTGMLSDTQIGHIEQTRKLLSEAGVAFIYGSYKKWFDFSSFDFQQDDEKELSRRFKSCFLHNCNRLHDGVLYACAHHYAICNLGVSRDCKDAVHIQNLTDSELVKALEDFKIKPFVDACKYCQMPFKAPLILAGGS